MVGWGGGWVGRGVGGGGGGSRVGGWVGGGGGGGGGGWGAFGGGSFGGGGFGGSEVCGVDLGKPKPPENPAIAALPFVNLSGDPEQEYFSDGLAEEMLDRLGRVPGLKVIARSSSFGFKGRDVDVKDVAERLGVTTVLEGSVRRDGRRLKLNARLIDGSSGQQVWSGSFDREVSDIFAVQAELASAIVNAIVPAARGEVIDSATLPTTDLKAYDLYLLARTQLAMRTPESIQKSVELMEQALALDPNFARAHAHLAASLLFKRAYDSNSAAEDALMRRAETSIIARSRSIRTCPKPTTRRPTC